MISANLSAIFYLISGVLFILALRGLSSPETSRQGNLLGILGMFIAARDMAKNPKILELLKILSEFPANPAMIAPTIITDEIAFVTDIKGVCKEGVTLHTTK